MRLSVKSRLLTNAVAKERTNVDGNRPSRYGSPVTRQAAKLDLDAAASFLESVPRGSWTSYGDVAVAAGRSSLAAQGIVSWIGSKGHLVANVHRVLNSDGEINDGWKASGPGLPASSADVRSLLLAEGVTFHGDRADPASRWRPSGDLINGGLRALARPARSRPSGGQSVPDAPTVRDLRDARVAHVLAQAVRQDDVDATDALRILRHELRRRNTGTKMTIRPRSHAAQTSVDKYAPKPPPANGSNDALHADHVFPLTIALLREVESVERWVVELQRLRAVVCVTASENYKLQVIEHGGITGPEKYAVAGIIFTSQLEW